MKKSPYNVGMIGLGRIALGYDSKSKPNQIFSHAKAVLKHPDTKWAWGVDPDLSARTKFNKFTGAEVYESLASIPQDFSVDILVVATPTPSHLEVLKESLTRFSPKLILMEKPIACNAVQARQAVNLCLRSGSALAVNYHLRFDPVIRKVFDQIAKQRFGKLQSGHAYYSKGVHNAASYYINLLAVAFGKPGVIAPLSINRVLFDGADADVDFLCRYADASVVFQSVNENCFSFSELDLVFEKARVCLRQLNEVIEVYAIENHKAFKGYKTLNLSKRIQPKTARYQYHVWDTLIKKMKSRDDFMTEARDALIASEVATEVMDYFTKGQNNVKTELIAEVSCQN